MTTKTIQKKAEKAIKAAARKLILERKKMGGSIHIWRDGKVVKVKASQLSRKRS